MKQSILIRATLVALLLAACCRVSWALGEEDFGNTPFNDANFKDWPGIMSVVNHPSRVYHTWVNGNEYFYYQGDTAALNDMLQKFTEAKTPVREVVLRPGPGVVRSFDRTKEIKFGWNLHLIGGIARYETMLDQGDKIWSTNPVLTIYVGKDMDLSKLTVPQGLTLRSISEVKQRAREALKSKDKTVRGWGAGVLASMDPFDMESLTVIGGLLKDKDDWVRLNAVHTVPLFGTRAKSLLPQLRDLQKTEDKSLKEAVPETIQSIEQAQDKTAAEKEHQATMEKIRKFLKDRKP